MKLTSTFALALLTSQLLAATPAELAIRQAVGNIEKQPAHYPYYNELATAYARRARETADGQFYVKAEEAVRKSLALAPDNFEALKVEAFLELERHEYSRALESAAKLNRTMPDDITIYGYLADANIELGNDKDAIDAAQWMLDLRPGNPAGLTRASYLRELHGNLAGALELMQTAFEATPPSETEERAWILAQTSHIELLTGDVTKAEGSANNSLAAFPDYHYALAALAQVRLAQGRYQEAVSLLQKRYDAAPHTGNLCTLAEAQELAGQHEAAEASFRKFEEQARAESTLADNSNRELIAYYVDRAGEPARALAIARREIARRHDVFTLDSYAWALAANGEYDQANRQIQTALAIGVKDPGLLFHAGSIALHLHQNDKAEAYLKNAAARHSREAARLLATMNGVSQAAER